MNLYKGVFDISDSTGVNDSERLLMHLCRKSFLSLWSYANLHTDRDMREGKGSAKEFADVLVVFGNDVIIFSDKHITFQEDNDLNIAWPRWYKKAVLDSAKQLYGAKKWISQYPNRVFLDPECKRPLPVSLPSLNDARLHLIAVTRGSFDACAEHFHGSIGTHQINTRITGAEHYSHPFTLGIVEPSKHFIHVWDEFSLEVVMDEMDTITDFVDYLNARTELLNDPALDVIATGEEQLVAAYLLNGGSEGRSFLPSGDKPDLVFFDESHYEGLKQRPEYIEKRRLDKLSKSWDEIIEQFIQLGDPAIVHAEYQQPSSDTEQALRLIASESRFRRRMLVDSLSEMLNAAQHKPGERRARVVTTRQHPDIVYIFLTTPKVKNETYDEYRRHRVAMLHAYCRCAKLKFPEGEKFIGLGIDHPIRDYKGGSEDLFVFICKEFTQEARAEAEDYRKKLNILSDNLELNEGHSDEFPVVIERRAPIQCADSHSPKYKNKRRKAKIAKKSRRANRKK